MTRQETKPAIPASVTVGEEGDRRCGCCENEEDGTNMHCSPKTFRKLVHRIPTLDRTLTARGDNNGIQDIISTTITDPLGNV